MGSASQGLGLAVMVFQGWARDLVVGMAGWASPVVLRLRIGMEGAAVLARLLKVSPLSSRYEDVMAGTSG